MMTRPVGSAQVVLSRDRKSRPRVCGSRRGDRWLYDKRCAILTSPTIFDNPYVTAFRAIFDFTAQGQHELGITEPIDFIFDQRGEKEQVGDPVSEVFKTMCDPAIRDRVGNEPRFERDEDFLPLQAADLLAWHVRKHWLEHRSITTQPLRVSWPGEATNPRGYHFDMDYHNLVDQLCALEISHHEDGPRHRHTAEWGDHSRGQVFL